MSCTYLILQGSYKMTEIALFKNEECIVAKKFESMAASAQLIAHLDELLAINGLALSDLSCIALNHGPGSFTSLRVLAASVNGISFATGLPLLEINGLEALALQVRAEASAMGAKHIVVLFNAFNQDVYFALYTLSGDSLVLAQLIAYENIGTLLERIKDLPAPVFTGNGAVLHRGLIVGAFPKAQVIEYDMPNVETLASMARCSLKERKQFTNKIVPLYLKIQHYVPKYVI
jgi:tRNA threonylcarbamoyl adenosine modification protein YeaZ